MNDHLVVDANVVAKLYLRDEQWVDRADNVFDSFGRGDIEIVAPRLLVYEVPAAISKALSDGRVRESDALDALRQFRQLPIPLVEETPVLLEEACRLANRYHCTLYDAIYLQLAGDLNWIFVTADDKLYRRVRTQAPYVVLLSTFRKAI